MLWFEMSELQQVWSLQWKILIIYTDIQFYKINITGVQKFDVE